MSRSVRGWLERGRAGLLRRWMDRLQPLRSGRAAGERESALEAARQQVISTHGEWTAHNIRLTESIYTRSAAEPAGCPGLFPVLRDFARKPLDQMRIIDLACLEGLYAVEFARAGAQVVAIEGREANLAKAKFAKDALKLRQLTLLHDDVRNLSVDRHGCFDIVFCSGILYHLDVPDVFHFARRMSEICTGFLFLNTHISPRDLGDNPAHLGDLEEFPFEGVRYHGRRYPEHDSDSPREERLKNLWASLDNPSSVWFTIESLQELLVHSGFSHVYHCLTYWNVPDRVTLIATKQG